MQRFSKGWLKQKTVNDPLAQASLLVFALAIGVLAVTSNTLLDFVSAFLTIGLASFVGSLVVYFVMLAAVTKSDEAKMSILAYWAAIAFALSLGQF